MSLGEVQEVARLAATSGVRPQGGGPTVHKVADALGIAPNDVEMLLDQARQGQTPMRDFKIVLGLVALVMTFMLGVGVTSLFGHRATSPSNVASTPTASSLLLPSSHSLVPAAGPVTELGRPSSASVATALDSSPSQLSGTLAPLEAKTLEGDIRKAKHRADQKVSIQPPTEGDGTQVVSCIRD